MVLNTKNEFLKRVFEKEKFLHQFEMYEGGFLNKTWVYNCFIVSFKNEKTVRFLVRSRFGYSFVPCSKIHNFLLVCWIWANKISLESLES